MTLARLLGTLALASLAALVAALDTPDPITLEGWERPPKAIEAALTAPWHENVAVSNLSPDARRFIVTESGGMPPLANLARPHLNLGGLMIDPVAQRARRFTVRLGGTFRIRGLEDGTDVPVRVPGAEGLSDVDWSPDGSTVTFLAHYRDASYVYVADTRTGQSRRLTDRPLLPTLATTVRWVQDGRAVVAVFRPADQGPAPLRPAVPATPWVRVSDRATNSIRTYADLLETPTDQETLAYYTTGQVGIVELATGKVTNVGAPQMIESVNPSPDGQWFIVETVERPFSYIVPFSQFGRREALWNAGGETVAELDRTPLRLGRLLDARPNDDARRSLTWRPDGAGLSFLQLAPRPAGETRAPSASGEDAEQPRGAGGAGQAAAATDNRKDRVMLWAAPFGKDDVVTVFESDQRITSVLYRQDAKMLFVTRTIEGKTRVSAVTPGAEPVLKTITDWRPDDFYNSPGSLVTKTGVRGGSVVRMSPDGRYVYLSGTKFDREWQKNAPRPFVDRVEVATGEKTRIFESRADVHESPSMLDDAGDRMLVTRQTPRDVPNTFLVDRATQIDRPVTQNRDFVPGVTQAVRRTVWVTRNDGFKFRVNVTMPRWALSGRNLPAFFWFYPGEFTNQAEYDRGLRSTNINAFNRPDMDLVTLAGYVLVEPDCPIVGPTGRINDNYVPQLRNNLSAIIDALDREGLVDRTRLAIGGHSYGGFSTANAMINTPFFRAGIAGAGNYNRTLTPFGFQAEGRQLWEMRETYLEMTPLLHAEQLTGALLLYHGMEDQNTGTSPINSVRMFNVLEALGKTTALYMYPYEDHGQIARETRLDQWARWIAWLDKHVKEAPKPEAETPPTDPAAPGTTPPRG